MLDYDPAQRAGELERFPCGCLVEPEWGHIRPCRKHEHITNEPMLWETLKAEFPADAMEIWDENSEAAP